VSSSADDGYNLYHFNSSGERIQRYRVGNINMVLNDVAVDSASGRVYIVSPTSQSLIRFDPSNAANTQMLFSGSQALNPVGVGLDSSGQIYVTDAISKKVLKYAKEDGSLMLEFTGQGTSGGGQAFSSIGD